MINGSGTGVGAFLAGTTLIATACGVVGAAVVPPAFAHEPSGLLSAPIATNHAPARWQTAVSAEPVRARDPAWSFIVTRIKAAPHVKAALGPIGSLPPLTGRSHALAGLASFYHEDQETASGEPFNRYEMTAAHLTLPFNTRVRVTDLKTGRAVVVRINDRGPYKPGRIIDLSEAAAIKLGIYDAGVTRVKVEVLAAR